MEIQGNPNTTASFRERQIGPLYDKQKQHMEDVNKHSNMRTEISIFNVNLEHLIGRKFQNILLMKSHQLGRNYSPNEQHSILEYEV